MQQAWLRSDVGEAALVGDVLVCEDCRWWHQDLANAPSIVGLSPDTGDVLWQRRVRQRPIEMLVGGWMSQVILVTPRPGDTSSSEHVTALSPRDGRKLWSLPLSLAQGTRQNAWEVGIHGKWLIAVRHAQAGAAVRVEGYRYGR